MYNDRGLAQFNLQNYEGAIADFSLAIRLNANDARAYYNRGCACQKHGDEHNAIHDFTQSLRLNPVNVAAYVNRGLARYQLGYQQAAIADLQQAAQGYLHQGETAACHKLLKLLQIQRDTTEWQIASIDA
ncbi:tetratricopeptide repeat protein [Gloeocapsopsis sp. IPPAS B-1203]|uniref:tetratricopeptide repeat protein n=1 Tax=Gloeocapsopsis sp. IPPAS B-1203 TaxID=2049454 RepID=UPI00338F5B42